MLQRLAVMVTLLLPGIVVSDEIELFNGKDLTGWNFVLDDPNAKMEDVWTVEDGIIHCKGNPRGYLETKEEYSDFLLTLQWRWKPGTKGGNSGVLLHSSTPREIGVWPKSIEAQLAAGNAGDIWVIGTTIEIPDKEKRVQGRRHLNLTDGSEKPIGEWNDYEILCKGDEIILKVNGEVVNHATKCSVQKGRICLQSEGAEVQFRNIKLRPAR